MRRTTIGSGGERPTRSIQVGGDEALNFNLLNGMSYPEEVRCLAPFYREGHVMTSSELKAEFRLLMCISEGVRELPEIRNG